MSLLGKFARFAQSPQGRRLVQKASQAAKDPENQRKIREAGERVRRKVDDTVSRRGSGHSAERDAGPTRRPPDTTG